MIYNTLLKAAAPAAGGGTSNILFFVAMFAVIYFFMIYPQMKKQKKQKKFREEITEGTKIVTIGGLHAKISKMNDDGTMIIDCEGTKLRVDRSAISMEATESINKVEKEKK